MDREDSNGPGRKRPRDEDESKEENDADKSIQSKHSTAVAIPAHHDKHSLNTRESPTDNPVPPYGSQEYWEQRYEKLKEKQDRSDHDESAPDPFHAWYFNFEELAPLLLPLILGDNDVEEVEEEEEEEEEEQQQQQQQQQQQTDSKNGNTQVEKQAKPKGQHKSKSDDVKDQNGQEDDESGDDQRVFSESDNQEEEEEEELDDDEEDETDSPPTPPGLAHKGPISVLEVGCGDVPLGRDLITAIIDLESEAEIDASNILEKVVCLDYSKNVIDAMKKDQKKQSRCRIPLEYLVADARKLPHDDQSFELLLEKGTLDAMLSDREGNGSDNCRKIVAECARVTKAGGCIVIISHVNAHCQTGLDWLNDIVVPGLRMGASVFYWSIEVHGNEAEIPSEDEADGGEGSDNSDIPESPGPAVYIIRKGKLVSNDATTKAMTEKDPPTVPLRFFSY
jgi:SAM-dependent methyltransferase